MFVGDWYIWPPQVIWLCSYNVTCSEEDWREEFYKQKGDREIITQFDSETKSFDRKYFVWNFHRIWIIWYLYCVTLIQLLRTRVIYFLLNIYFSQQKRRRRKVSANSILIEDPIFGNFPFCIFEKRDERQRTLDWFGRISIIFSTRSMGRPFLSRSFVLNEKSHLSRMDAQCSHRIWRVSVSREWEREDFRGETRDEKDWISGTGERDEG